MQPITSVPLLHLLKELAGQVAEQDRHRLAEIVALFGAPAETICPMGLPKHGEAMHRARIDLRAIAERCLARCDDPGVATELLRRFPESG